MLEAVLVNIYILICFVIFISFEKFSESSRERMYSNQSVKYAKSNRQLIEGCTPGSDYHWNQSLQELRTNMLKTFRRPRLEMLDNF